MFCPSGIFFSSQPFIFGWHFLFGSVFSFRVAFSFRGGILFWVGIFFPGRHELVQPIHSYSGVLVVARGGGSALRSSIFAREVVQPSG